MSTTKKELTAEEQAIAQQQAYTKALLDLQAKLDLKEDLMQKLEGELSAKDIEIKRLNDALAEAEDLITEQQAALSEPVDESEKVHVTHEKKKYHVVVPRFKLGGIEYTAADLKSKPDVVKQLVERRSSVLVAVK